jgi:hypothetical protein
MQNGLLYVGESQAESLPKCACCGVKNRVPASIRCMIQFASFSQFAQQMDADAKRTIYKGRGGRQGRVKQRKCSETITRR